MLRRFLIFLISVFFFIQISSNVFASITINGNAIKAKVGIDYASDALSDAWDMSNNQDVSAHSNLTNTLLSSGQFSATTVSTDSNINLNTSTSIDTSVYKRISFRLYSSIAGTGQLNWYYNQEKTNFQNWQFSVKKGWNIYSLGGTSAWSAKWTGKPLSLQLLPVNTSNADFSLDWIHLTDSGSNYVYFSWLDSQPNYNSYKIYVDADNAGYDGLYINQVSSSSRSTTSNLRLLATGTYYMYVEKTLSNGLKEYSNYIPVAINARPYASTIDPSTNQNSEQFLIKYNTSDSDDSSLTTRIYADRDRTINNGNDKLLSNTIIKSGTREFLWEPEFSDNSSYYIYTYVSDGLNADYDYSSGKAITYKDPKSPVTNLSLSASGLLPDTTDYATKTFSDPWDMSNSQDITQQVVRFSNASISNGLWQGLSTSIDSYFWFLWGGYPGSYLGPRDGARNPINTNIYNRITFKMYLSQASDSNVGTFYWFNRMDLKNPQAMQFIAKSGWNIYQLDLPWSGQSPVSLRLDPINRANTHVAIDWIKLTSRAGLSSNIAWRDTVRGEPDLYVDNDQDGFDGSYLRSISTVNRNNSQNIDLDGLISGDYYFYVAKKYANSNYSSAFSINNAPVVKIIEPDEAGGNDWATTVLKNPWDMKSRKDITLKYNIKGVSFKRGVFSGINGKGANGNRANDPYFLLNLGSKSINTSRYHRLNIKYKYAGDFSLKRGTMSRVGWTTKKHDDPKYWQITDDILTYDGWNNLVIDLKKIKLNRGKFGWRNLATKLRFDPHEDPYSRRFFIDSVSLREDDRLRTSFNIKYNLSDANNASVNLRIYADRDKNFGNGNEKLISNFNTASGNKSYRWKPSRKLKGTFWIYIRANDGTNVNGFYSSGPLKVH